MSEETEQLEEVDEDQDDRPALDPETQARRDAALALVRKFGDPVLRSKALAVERFDERLRAEIERLAEIMDDGMGIGLAATQLGILHRVLVYRVGGEAPLVALVNPEIEWSDRDEESSEEGCLSLPGVLVDIDRPVHVRVSARDEHGDGILVEASGLEARVILHEMDHLEGVLILDRAPRDQRRQAMRTLRERQDAQAA